MPLTTDLHRIRAALDRDRAWSAYAIGDLDPQRLGHCSWYAPAADPDALVLLYRAFEPPILFAIGDPARLGPLFAELDAPVVSLQVLPEALTALAPAYTAAGVKEMWRMSLDAGSFRQAPAGNEVARLNPSHAGAVETLFADARQA